MPPLKKAIYLLGGTLILMSVALFNGYPLFYWDSAAYIRSGFEEFVPWDRPAGYGLFISYTTFGRSLWYLVIFQNLITAYVILETCAAFFSPKRLGPAYLLITALLTCFTGVAWFSNQVMPDIFTPVLALAIYLLLFTRPGLLRTLALGLVIVLSLAFHYSHLMIGASLAGLAVLYGLWAWLRKKDLPARYGRKLVFAITFTALGWLAVPCINYALEGKFFLSKHSRIFFLAHLVDNGILQQFLNENCGNPYYSKLNLCRYYDQIPTDLSTFLWEENGVFDKIGGIDSASREADEVVYAVMTSRYMWMNVKRTVYYTGIQLLRNDLGEGLQKFRENSQAYWQMTQRFPYQVNFYINARQQTVKLEDTIFRDLNRVNLLVQTFHLFALVLIFATGFYRSCDKATLRFLVFALILLLVNALIMAAFNAPTHRYQARVSWVMTMAVVIFFVKNRGLLFYKVRMFLFPGKA